MDNGQLTIKKTIRQQQNSQRNNLSSQEIAKFSQQICKRILLSSLFKKAKTIASYLPINNEVDLSALFNQSKVYALPVLQKNKTMTFNEYNDNENLIKNHFGILEPKNNKTIEPHAINLCLMPLVAFNRNGSRVGMGGGYYDRYFELNKFKKKSTILAGIAYDFQEDATIQSDPWDIPLDLIITNREIIKS